MDDKTARLRAGARRRSSRFPPRRVKMGRRFAVVVRLCEAMPAPDMPGTSLRGYASGGYAAGPRDTGTTDRHGGCTGPGTRAADRHPRRNLPDPSELRED